MSIFSTKVKGKVRAVRGSIIPSVKWSRQATGYFMIAPSLVFLSLVILYPLFQTLRMSLYEFTGIRAQTATFVGLGNFIELLGDPLYWKSMKNTWLFTLGSVVGHLVIGGLYALILNQHWFSNRLRALVRGLLMLPWFFSIAATGLMWGLLFHPLGTVNYLLVAVGLLSKGVDFLGRPETALWALTIMNIWQFFPFYMLMILGGLQTIPDDLYDAAQVDGANRLQRFLYVTFPLMVNVLVAATAIDFIGTFSFFDLVRILTNGGPRRSTMSLGYYTWRVGFRDVDFGYGSTISVSILLLVGIVMFFYLRVARREESSYG